MATLESKAQSLIGSRGRAVGRSPLPNTHNCATVACRLRNRRIKGRQEAACTNTNASRRAHALPVRPPGRALAPMWLVVAVLSPGAGPWITAMDVVFVVVLPNAVVVGAGADRNSERQPRQHDGKCDQRLHILSPMTDCPWAATTMRMRLARAS